MDPFLLALGWRGLRLPRRSEAKTGVVRATPRECRHARTPKQAEESEISATNGQNHHRSQAPNSQGEHSTVIVISRYEHPAMTLLIVGRSWVTLHSVRVDYAADRVTHWLIAASWDEIRERRTPRQLLPEYTPEATMIAATESIMRGSSEDRSGSREIRAEGLGVVRRPKDSQRKRP